MSESYVVGKTTPQEIYVANDEKPFLLDEYLKINDSARDDTLCEVINTCAYESIQVDTFPAELGIFESLKNLKNLGFINKENIYIAKVRLLEESQLPITPGSTVSYPDFEQIEEILLNKVEENGLTLGVIKGTEALKDKMPKHLQSIAPLLDTKKGIVLQNGVPFILNHFSFKEYPHIGLFGGSGSGKTFGLRVICEELMKKGIPAIVLDPHYELTFTEQTKNLPNKNQYDFSKKHEVFQVGDNVGIKFVDLSTAELLSLMEYVADVSPAMRGAIEALHERNEAFVSLFSKVQKLKTAFENEEKPIYKRADLAPDAVTLYLKYKNSISGSVTLQALLWRLDQLDKTGVFEHDIKEIESCLLKRKFAIIRGRPLHVKMVASYVIKKLYSKRRAYKDWEQKSLLKPDMANKPDKFPPFFIILDEAHNFAPDGIQSTPIKSVLREISQEARKYGVNLVFGTQRPGLLDSTIIAMLNTKIIFRTNIESDLERIQKETTLDETQLKRLPILTSGNAYISSAILRKTLYMRFRVTSTTSPHSENPFDELDDFDDDSKIREVLLSMLPLSAIDIPKVHSKINHESNTHLSVSEISELLDKMSKLDEIEKESSPFGNRYFEKNLMSK